MKLFPKWARYTIGIMGLVLVLGSCAVKRGIYHEVRRGETLWRISQAYDVDLDLILRANDIENARQVQVGRLVLIPEASRTRTINTSGSRRTSSSTSSSTSYERIPPYSSESSESSQSDVSDRIRPKPEPSASSGSGSGSEEFQPVWPCQGRIVSRFDKGGDPTRRGVMMHVAPGSPVKSMESGTIRLAKQVNEPAELKQLGKLVMIFHSDNFVSVYAHLDKIAVEKGDDVNRGQTIGHAGNTGYVDQDSCYFQIRYKVEPRDPLLFLGEPS